MTSKEAIEKIKVMLFGEQVQPVPEPQPDKVQMAEIKTADGKILQVDKMEVGGNVVMNGAPAPDGEYALEDGTVVSVAGGLITEIAAKVEEGTEDMSKKLAMSLQEQTNTITKLNAQVDDLKKQVSNYQTAVKEMFSLVETISNNSIEKPKERLKWDDMNPLQKFRANKSLN